jgi:hypothetical protein
VFDITLISNLEDIHIVIEHMATTRRNAEAGPKAQLVQLAESISQNAQLIGSFLHDNNLPHQSFKWEAPLSMVPPTASEPISDTRHKLMDAAKAPKMSPATKSSVLPHIHATHLSRYVFKLTAFKLISWAPSGTPIQHLSWKSWMENGEVLGKVMERVVYLL